MSDSTSGLRNRGRTLTGPTHVDGPMLPVRVGHKAWLVELGATPLESFARGGTRPTVAPNQGSLDRLKRAS